MSCPGCGQSFEVLEGVTTTGSLNGLVIGDPVVVLTSLTLDPGQSASGFIAADPPLPTSIPEPVSVVLFGTGLVGLCALRSRKAA